MKTYYQVLGVSSNASDDEIKHAYWNLMKKFHPDKGGNYTDEKARKVIEAYQAIQSSGRRRTYDQSLINQQQSYSWSTSQQDNKRDQALTQKGAWKQCKECKGHGWDQHFGVSHKCRYCDGKGWVPGSKPQPR